MKLRFAVKEIKTGYVELDVSEKTEKRLCHAAAELAAKRGNMVVETHNLMIAEKPIEVFETI